MAAIEGSFLRPASYDCRRTGEGSYPPGSLLLGGWVVVPRPDGEPVVVVVGGSVVVVGASVVVVRGGRVVVVERPGLLVEVDGGWVVVDAFGAVVDEVDEVDDLSLIHI